MGCTVAGYDNSTTAHPAGCKGNAPPAPSKKTPQELGLVLKLSF